MNWKTTISIDIEAKGNGIYDVYMATENSSGAHYPSLNAKQIGEHTAELIDVLEESYS